MGDFTDKVVLVTGGASGMGAALARIVVREGGRIAIADLNEDLGQAMVDELGAMVGILDAICATAQITE